MSHIRIHDHRHMILGDHIRDRIVLVHAHLLPAERRIRPSNEKSHRRIKPARLGQVPHGPSDLQRPKIAGFQHPDHRPVPVHELLRLIQLRADQVVQDIQAAAQETPRNLHGLPASSLPQVAVRRQEGVAVVQVVPQLKEHGGLHPLLTVGGKAQFQRHGVGLEEVRATKWAEKEKLDARRSAALEVLQSQKEEFQAYLTGGERGLADYYKAAHGFTMDDLAMTPEQLAGFQKAQKHMLENLLPNFRDPEEVAREKEAARQSFSAEIEGRTYSYNEILGGLSEQFDEKMRQLVPQQGNENRLPRAQNVAAAPQVQIAVNIENAVTQDSEGMRLLADQVADRIRPTVENALGGGENTYSNW